MAERIRRLEQSGIIAGYAVKLNPKMTGKTIQAIISISVTPKERPNFQMLLQKHEDIELCHQVTGSYSHMVKVNCASIEGLEQLLNKLQKHGQTSTQIILSTTKDGQNI